MVVETAEADADTGWLPEQGMASHFIDGLLLLITCSGKWRHVQGTGDLIPRSASFVADVIFLRMNLRNSAWRHGRVRIET